MHLLTYIRSGRALGFLSTLMGGGAVATNLGSLATFPRISGLHLCLKAQLAARGRGIVISQQFSKLAGF